MADPEWHWADPIILNFNRHPPSSELTFVNWLGPDSLYKWNEVKYESLVEPGYPFPSICLSLWLPLWTPPVPTPSFLPPSSCLNLSLSHFFPNYTSPFISYHILSSSPPLHLTTSLPLSIPLTSLCLSLPQSLYISPLHVSPSRSPLPLLYSISPPSSTSPSLYVFLSLYDSPPLSISVSCGVDQRFWDPWGRSRGVLLWRRWPSHWNTLWTLRRTQDRWRGSPGEWILLGGQCVCIHLFWSSLVCVLLCLLDGIESD